MKITKAQKDAVISLLKEKFENKNNEVKKAYIEAHRAEIEAKIDEYLRLQAEAKALLIKFKEISKTVHHEGKCTEGDIVFDDIRVDYDMYHRPWNTEAILYTELTKEDLLKKVIVNKINEPNYNIVARELELASLGKDFDLEGFLAKYLPQ